MLDSVAGPGGSSSPPADTTADGSKSPRGDLATGAIVGIVIAVLVALSLALFALVVWHRRRRRRQRQFFVGDNFVQPDVGVASSTFLADGPFLLQDKSNRSRETLAPQSSSGHLAQRSNSDLSSFHSQAELRRMGGSASMSR
ncbi:hypothetical protein H4R19_005585 [Coemansia spiralis]|nr:hypothetical protein H4R19_005585 [Coemansia spiralis]